MNRYQTRVCVLLGVMCTLLVALLFKAFEHNKSVEEIASFLRDAEVIEFIDK